MRRVIVLTTTLSLLACGGASSNSSADAQTNVYDLPVPDRNDVEAIQAIGLALKYKDQNPWRNIMTLPRNNYRPEMTSATVGKALTRYEAYLECVVVKNNALAKLGEPPTDRSTRNYKKKIAAYDAAMRLDRKATYARLRLPT